MNIRFARGFYLLHTVMETAMCATVCCGIIIVGIVFYVLSGHSCLYDGFHYHECETVKESKQMNLYSALYISPLSLKRSDLAHV